MLCRIVLQNVFSVELDPVFLAQLLRLSKRGDRLKLLYWEATGYALWYKRLEAGTFRFPAASEEQPSLSISATDLAMLLDGVDLASVRRRKRYQRSA